MKKAHWILAVLIMMTVAITGCKKNEPAVDTATLESSFQSAEPATQSSANKAVTAIKAGDYGTALAELKTLSSNAKLTPEQQQAIKNVMAQVQQAFTGVAADAKDQLNKTATDLQKSLPK